MDKKIVVIMGLLSILIIPGSVNSEISNENLIEEILIGDSCETMALNDWNITNVKCDLDSTNNICNCYNIYEDIVCLNWEIKSNSKKCISYGFKSNNQTLSTIEMLNENLKRESSRFIPDFTFIITNGG